MNKQLLSAIVAIILFALLSCSNKPENNSIKGKWSINNISYSPTDESLDTLSLADIGAMITAGNELKPSSVLITDKSLILYTSHGDSSILRYAHSSVEDGKFILQTEKGACTFTFTSDKEAVLSFSGATYSLTKSTHD